MAADVEGNSKKLRTRSPAYPYLDLRTALDKAATLWKAEGRHPAAVNVVMHHWGYKEESSTGYSCMAALKKYGLIELDGTGENKQIRLSSLALAILLDENPDSPDRLDALRTAAMGPRIHAELWERYGAALPSDQSLKRYLVLEKSFNEAAVDELLAEYKQTISFAGLNLLPAPTVSATAFAPAAAAPPSSAVAASYAPQTVSAPVSRAAAPAAVAAPDELPYDWRQEAGPAAFQAPPRASGPADGTRNREAEPFRPSARGPATGRENVPASPPPPQPGQNNGGNERRRASAGYLPDRRQGGEREPMRHDQDDFGDDEDGYAPPVRTSASYPAPGNSGRFAPPAMVPAFAAGGVELETSHGATRKELPVPLDGTTRDRAPGNDGRRGGLSGPAREGRLSVPPVLLILKHFSLDESKCVVASRLCPPERSESASVAEGPSAHRERVCWQREPSAFIQPRNAVTGKLFVFFG